jgi:hypothetical protein
MEVIGSKRGNLIEIRPIYHNRAFHICIHLTLLFNNLEDMIEFRNRGGLEHTKEIPGEVVSNVGSFSCRRMLEQIHGCVDQANNRINIFTLVFMDLEIANLEEQELQSAFRAVMETLQDKKEHQRTTLTGHRSSKKFLVALVPKLGINVIAEKLEEEVHAFTHIGRLTPTMIPQTTQDDLIFSEKRKVMEEIKSFGMKISTVFTVNGSDNSTPITKVILGDVLFNRIPLGLLFR